MLTRRSLLLGSMVGTLAGLCGLKPAKAAAPLSQRRLALVIGGSVFHAKHPVTSMQQMTIVSPYNNRKQLYVKADHGGAGISLLGYVGTADEILAKVTENVRLALEEADRAFPPEYSIPGEGLETIVVQSDELA